METHFQEYVHYLTAMLGPTLVAYMTGTPSRSNVTAWVDPDKPLEPKQDEFSRIYTAYVTFISIKLCDDEDTARSWMIGMNPWLGDNSPASYIREDKFKEVNTAVKAYLFDQGGA